MDFDGDGEVDSDEEVDITPTVATQEQLARLTAVMDGADATITAIQTTKAQLSEKVEVQDMRKSMMSSEDWERDIHANVLYHGYAKKRSGGTISKKEDKDMDAKKTSRMRKRRTSIGEWTRKMDRRYFALERTRLLWFKNETGFKKLYSEPKGEAQLAGSVLVCRPATKKAKPKFKLLIKAQVSVRALTIVCESDADYEKWIKQLTSIAIPVVEEEFSDDEDSSQAAQKAAALAAVSESDMPSFAELDVTS